MPRCRAQDDKKCPLRARRRVWDLFRSTWICWIFCGWKCRRWRKRRSWNLNSKRNVPVKKTNRGLPTVQNIFDTCRGQDAMRASGVHNLVWKDVRDGLVCSACGHTGRNVWYIRDLMGGTRGVNSSTRNDAAHQKVCFENLATRQRDKLGKAMDKKLQDGMAQFPAQVT